MIKSISQSLLPLLVLVVALLTVVSGCANNKNAKMQKNAGVTDINVAPVAPRESETAYAGPLNGAPSYYQQPAITQTPTAAAPPAAASAAGGSYVVKKGDTLFSIAKANYGSGNHWQKITAANPGLSPTTLKAGQTIVLP